MRAKRHASVRGLSSRGSTSVAGHDDSALWGFRRESREERRLQFRINGQSPLHPEMGRASRRFIRRAEPADLSSGDFGRHRRTVVRRRGIGQFLVALGGDFPPVRHDAARAGRDEPTDDDVLLEADQAVDPTRDRGLGKDAGGLLEGRRRDERLGLQARLGDALQHRPAAGGTAIELLGLAVLFLEVAAIDLFADQEGRVAGLVDLDLLQHLANDHLDVLVVDLHALQTIDLLDLVDQVVRQRLDTHHLQDVVRNRVTVHQRVALADIVAFLHRDVLALGDQILDRIAILRHHQNTALGLVVLAEFDAAVDVRDDRVILRAAGFEQLGHTRQTAGDVAGLRRFARDAGQHVAGMHLRTVLDRQDRVHRHEVAGFQAVAELDDFTRFITQGDARAQVGTARLLLPIDDHLAGDTGRLVENLTHGEAFDQVDIVGHTFALREDRQGVGVPLGQLGTLGDLGAFVGQQLGAVGNAVTGLFTAVRIGQHHFAVTAHHDNLAGRVGHDVAVEDLNLGFERGLDRGLLGATLRRATDVERTHGELSARLADRLGGDDADRFAGIDLGAAGQIAAIAGAADAGLGFAGQHRADADDFDAGRFDLLDQAFVDQAAGGDDHRTVGRVDHVARRGTAEDTLAQAGDDFAAFQNRRNGEAAGGAAIVFDDDGVLGHVDQTAGQVTRVRGLQRGVGQTLTGAVGGVEVLQHGEAFLEVRDDRRLDDFTRRLGHQAAHAGQLLHLGGGTAGAGMRHHVDGVDRLAGLRRADLLHHRVGDVVGALRPGVDHLVVLFALGDQAVLVLLLIFLDARFGLADQRGLGRRDNQIVLAERNAGAAGVGIAQAHDAVGEDHRLFLAAMAVDDVDDVLDVLLGQQAVDQGERNLGAARQHFGQQHAARSGLDTDDDLVAFLVDGAIARLDLGMQADRLGIQRLLDFLDVGEDHAFALLAGAFHRDVVQAQDDVLGRHDDRLAVGGRQDVVGRHHQHAGFELGFQRQRHVDRHLVTVEVGVEGGADERMQLDGLTLDQHRFEGLDAQAVQGRGAVQHHRMLADDLFQDVPHLGTLLLDHALGGLDGGRHAVQFELGTDERLEQLERHLLRQAALMQLQLRTDDDDRTAGIVDALAEQVLTEAALLALEHVGQRLQRTLVGAGDGAAAAAVVEQSVDGFLQHALFVAHDDLGRAQLDQALQTVVTVDDAAIEIVQIRGGETAAIERDERTQFRRNDRNDFQDHPFRTAIALEERLDQLQTLDQLLALGFRGGLAQLGLQGLVLGGEIDRLQQRADRLGADADLERVFAIFLDRALILLFGQQLMLLQRGQARLGDDVVLEIQDALEILQRHVDQETDARRQRLQEPDVSDRRGQLDMAHALAAHLGQGHFDAALLADDAAILHALVLAAQALVILDGPEDAGAEQAVALGLEGTIVDGFGLLDLAERPGADALGTGDGDLDLVEALRSGRLAEDFNQFVHNDAPVVL